MPVEAVQHVRRMRGGAQAHLMRADDGHFYVVKFQNNPQHLRVLANELLATRLPESMLPKVKNLAAFAGMLVADKWLGNANGRQAVFWKKSNARKYTATFIDQGYCFNAGEWTFPDSALRGVYARNFVYQQITGWESFEPWLSRVEDCSPSMIQEIAGTVPPEWTGHDWDNLQKLTETIVGRRNKVRELITAFRNSTRQPFPAWGQRGAENSIATRSAVQ